MSGGWRAWDGYPVWVPDVPFPLEWLARGLTVPSPAEYAATRARQSVDVLILGTEVFEYNAGPEGHCLPVRVTASLGSRSTITRLCVSPARKNLMYFWSERIR